MAEMLMLILLLLQWLGSLTNAAGLTAFSNVMLYPTITVDNVYRFELNVTESMSMAIQNPENGRYSPVDFNVTDRHFYKRNPSLFEMCNVSTVVTDPDEQKSIVVAGGLHRQVLLFNKQFPGPSIVVPKDAKVEIKVCNNLRLAGVSVHWHGQAQKGTFQMDGVTRITQCPIMPGDYFVYKFTASEVGTHWYHSHSSAQRTDGLVGAFIVVDPSTYINQKADSLNMTDSGSLQKNSSKASTPNEARMPGKVLQANPRYQSEFIVFLQDWMNMDSESAVNHPMTGNAKFWNGYDGNKGCFYPMRVLDGSFVLLRPESVIINGKGWHTLPTFINQLDTFNTIASALPIERFKVQPNGRYLFRMVGSNMGFPIVISINGHKMTLVASDGNPLKPIENLDYLIVNGGERYDFEVETKDSSESNFYVIVKLLPTLSYDYNPLTKDYYGIGILDYNAPDEALTYIQPSCSPITPCRMANCPFRPVANPELECISVGSMHSNLPNEQNLQLFKSKYTESEFEERFLNLIFSPLGPSINGNLYMLPRFPPFFSPRFDDSIEGLQCSSNCTGETTCKCASLIPLTAGKVIQLTIYNMGRGSGLRGTNHPVHLHGYHFYVIATGYADYDASGKFVRPNSDIACFSNTSLCRDVGWSNPDFNMGNVPNANLVDPPKKDTVMIPVGGYVVVRFLADNIGYWFIHCHLEVHTVEGMATLIRVGTHEEIRKKVNWDNLNTCARGFERVSSPEKKKEIRFDIAFYICLSLAAVFLITTLTLSIYVCKKLLRK